jgi:dihydrofolate synthase/folylpolyglutamate synthase
MRALLARAGNPEQGLRVVHVAGTKGKGSTAAMVARILRAAGLRVGLYTSPHLVTFRERIQLDGALISEEEVAALVAACRPLIEAMRGSAAGAPTFFEVYTLLALRWFAQRQVDFAVLETGMGGRLDATNVVRPLACAITTLALDHQTELGDTLTAIAGEKAGIIKQGAPVVSAPQTPDAAAVIACAAATQHCPLYRVGQEIRLQPGPCTADNRRFTISGRHGVYADLTCALLGDHQLLNAAVAVGVIECLQDAGTDITETAIRAGLEQVVWPGRLQTLQERPLILLDGAHDPASITVLLAALERHFPARRRHFIVGFAREKDWPQMLRQLAPSAATLTLTAAATPRAVPPATLSDAAQTLGVPIISAAPDAATALRLARASAAPDDLLCVTGSLYLVGDVLKCWGTEEG